MAPEAMRDLGRRVVELLVERSERLPEGDAWDGEFRQGLVDQLMMLPPEEGRSAVEVVEQAAREAAGHPERATVYMSDRSHSAHIRAARIIGIRPECIRLLPDDGHFRLDAGHLASAVAEDRAAGFHPIAVCANAGASSTGAIDPLEAMADFCEAEGIWLHVDAAYGGFAVVTERGRELWRGIERADSIGMDAHKWFFQPYEAGSLLVKDVSTLDARSGCTTISFRTPSGAPTTPTSRTAACN